MIVSQAQVAALYALVKSSPFFELTQPPGLPAVRPVRVEAMDGRRWEISREGSTRRLEPEGVAEEPEAYEDRYARQRKRGDDPVV